MSHTTNQKKAFFAMLLFVGFGVGCRDKLLQAQYYQYHNPTVEQTVQAATAAGKIGPHPLFVLEGRPLKGPKIGETLSGLRAEDLAQVQVLEKNKAKAIYGSLGRQGAVELQVQEDELLQASYYDFNNPLISQLVAQFQKRDLVQPQPLYVLDGEPLKGDAIRTRLSELEDEQIAAVEVLRQTTAYELYGAQARRGVVLVTTKKAARNAAE